MAIDVILAEREETARNGAIQRLTHGEDNINVVAHTGNGHEMIRLVREHLPVVAILAVLLDGLNGLQVLEQIQDLVPVLFFTPVDEPDTIYQALLNGARGYILKFDQRITLSEAVRRVADGDMVLTEACVRPFVNCVRQHQTSLGVEKPPLTPREVQVLELIAKGKSHKEVATQIGIAPSTVKTHASAIHRKLGVRGQTAAVRKAMTLGLIDGFKHD